MTHVVFEFRTDGPMGICAVAVRANLSLSVGQGEATPLVEVPSEVLRAAHSAIDSVRSGGDYTSFRLVGIWRGTDWENDRNYTLSRTTARYYAHLIEGG